MKNLTKGQAFSGAIILTAMLTGAGGWLLNRVLASPDDLATSISAVREDVAVLKVESQRYKEDIDSINSKLDRLLWANGINPNQ